MTENHSPHEDKKENESLTDRVLGRISSDRVKPRSRFSFAAENWFFWVLGAIAVAFGALASSAALFELANAGWSFYSVTHPNLLIFTLAAAPFLWLLALALFILIGYENIRRTKRGYRYPFALIIVGSVLTSILLGTALFAAGFGEEIEESLGNHLPFYQPVLFQEHSWWLQPGRGLLGGQVIAVSTTSDSFTLKDFNGSIWTVDATNLGTTSIAAVERGGTVRVEGVPDANATSTLLACAVFSWQTYGSDDDQAPPPPFGAIPPPPERTGADTRNQLCKGTRPYTSPDGSSTTP